MVFSNTNSRRRLVILGSVLLAGALMATGAANVATAQDKVIKNTAIQQTDASSDKVMYSSYCAACHGAAGQRGRPGCQAN
jgi:mono/diheme cytochrome c family protein